MVVVPFPSIHNAPRLALERASLFLDLDGALLAFADDPVAVRADGGLLALLVETQARMNGRLAVLSGRSVASVDKVLGGAVITIAGVHGLQQRTAVTGLVETPPHPALKSAAAALARFAGADRRLRVERKRQGVALHYRQAPETAGAVIDMVDCIAKAANLQVQQGAFVAELRAPGPTAGSAIRRFMNYKPFFKTVPIVIGQEATGEAAFLAAQSLGGIGICVGQPTASSAANGSLADPHVVQGWLDTSLKRGYFDLAETGCRWS